MRAREQNRQTCCKRSEKERGWSNLLVFHMPSAQALHPQQPHRSPLSEPGCCRRSFRDTNTHANHREHWLALNLPRLFGLFLSSWAVLTDFDISNSRAVKGPVTGRQVSILSYSLGLQVRMVRNRACLRVVEERLHTPTHPTPSAKPVRQSQLRGTSLDDSDFNIFQANQSSYLNVPCLLGKNPELWRNRNLYEPYPNRYGPSSSLSNQRFPKRMSLCWPCEFWAKLSAIQTIQKRPQEPQKFVIKSSQGHRDTNGQLDLFVASCLFIHVLGTLPASLSVHLVFHMWKPDKARVATKKLLRQDLACLSA